MTPTALCRDCLAIHAGVPEGRPGRCPSCGSRRVVVHAELHDLAVAHVDCDAFYAAVEKRDEPALRDHPVVVGGGHRGVVAAACYLARLYGVRSAMPMYRALKLCPDAVVIRPDMAKYARVGANIRRLMNEVTDAVQSLSIDEAFLDLSPAGHGYRSPAQALARLIQRIEEEVGVTASVGLSYNKFLAKIASDLDKPRGFAVIGRAEAASFLADKPTRILWGVGAAMQDRLQRDGIDCVGDLQGIDEPTLVRRYGAIGHRLHQFAQGQDDRPVEPRRRTKSVSAETTFAEDIASRSVLRERIWPLCRRVADRLAAKRLSGRSVTLKLKTADFRLLTRSQRLQTATASAEALFAVAATLLDREATGTPFRLVGVGAGDLVAEAESREPELSLHARQPARSC